MTFVAGWLDWLTLSLAITWTLAGAILVLIGWVSLPRDPESSDSETVERSASATARILGGALLAGAVTLIAAYTLIRGQGWAAQGFRAFGVALRDLAVGGTWLADRVKDGLDWLLFRSGTGRAITGWLDRHLLADKAYALANAAAVVGAVVVGGFAGWMSTSSRWRVSGVLTYLGLDLVALGLIGLSLVVFESAQGPVAQGLGLWVVGVELFALGLFLAYQFYTLEFIAGRGPGGGNKLPKVDPKWTPFVLVQVACYNEPIAIVRSTLEAIRELRYPRDRFVVQLVDDSTDAGLVSELSLLAAEMGVRFQHRPNRRGFKGGALNDGLAAIEPAPDLVAIVDADYVVDPDFLRFAVQPFKEPKIGFVQTPQAYRNARRGTFARWYALADAYFYQVVQPVRARVQSLIFCGTMGIIRQSALRDCGGWSEECLTEDAELSLRMLARGWRGVYLRTPFGWGLAPESMSAVRSQHRRWAFGGLQMLRLNRDPLGGPGLSSRQRRDFRMGGLFWMDGIFLCALTATLAAIVVATWFGVHLTVQSTAAVAILASAPLLLMLDGILKIRVALRSSTPVTYRDVLGVMGFWFAIKINDLRAALRGWSGARMAFVRTPKEAGTSQSAGADFKAAVRDSALETTIAGVLLSIVGVTVFDWGLLTRKTVNIPEWLLLGWLVYYALVFLAAPLYDFSSRRGLQSSVDTSGASTPLSAAGPRTSSSKDSHSNLRGSEQDSRRPAVEQLTSPPPGDRALGSPRAEPPSAGGPSSPNRVSVGP
ncbi:MAG: glycosyltransferase [Thermoplasmata archaeon]